MDKAFIWYKTKNDIRSYMNNSIWSRLGRHGFLSMSQKMMHREKYGNRVVNGDLETNNLIINMLESDKPCMVARFGLTEMNFLYSYLNYKTQANGKNYEKLVDAMNRLSLLSGFFPNDLELGERFADLYFESIPEMDLCGVWNLYMEDYVLDEYAPQCQLAELKYL